MNLITQISVPLWQGAEFQGSEKAPQCLLEGGLDALLRRYTEVKLLSMPIIPHMPDEQHKFIEIANYLQQLKFMISEAMRDSLPFVIGGDHTIGLSSVAAAAERYDDLAVIWFDAHGDINTEDSSPTGHIHGMPLAAAMGLCHSELNEVATKRISPDHIFWVGTRSLDEGERKLAERLHLHMYSSQYVRQYGIPRVMREIQDELQRMRLGHLHCSIDIDVIDPTIVAATGVREKDGLSTEDYNLFVEALGQLPVQLTSLDFVEYNPLLDDEEMHTRTWCLCAIERLMNAINR